MPVIRLLPHLSKGQQWILIRPMTQDDKINLGSSSLLRWSEEKQYFFTRDRIESRNQLFRFLRSKHYYVDYSELKPLKNRPDACEGQQGSHGVESKLKKVGSYTKKGTRGHSEKHSSREMYQALGLELKAVLKDYVSHLRGKRLSESTVSLYGYFVLRFLYFAKSWETRSWSNHTLDLFLQEVMAKEDYSISSHRQCVSALKYFTILFDIENFDASQLKRPKKSRMLPVVLSKEEVIDLLQATRNLKHRTILALMYSSGLRIGELLHLKRKHIDLDRNQLFIKQSKGRKDREVMLSEVIRPLLQNYIRTYRPEVFLMEGQKGGMYSPTSIRNFLKRSCKLAGINKRVTPHTLRHSFATHMMENGVSLRHIQELLGHAKPETTMIYTHVVQKDLMRIKSPLDTTVAALTKNQDPTQKLSLSQNFRE